MNSPLVASQDPALVPKQMPTSPTVELAVTSSALADARVRTRTTVDGIQFDRVDLAQATRVTLELAAAKGPALVVTPNLDILRLCHEQPRLRDMVNDADLVLPDGWPVLAAARLMHKPHSTPSTRVPGSELLWTVSAGG